MRPPLHPALVTLGSAALGLLLACCKNSTNAIEPAPPTAERQAEAVTEVPASEAEHEELADAPWPYEWIEGEPMFKLMEHDDLPSIDAPVFVDADAADAFMDMDEVVLGVVGPKGTAKCYSAWQLDSHEIVNDEIDGQAIAATW